MSSMVNRLLEALPDESREYAIECGFAMKDVLGDALALLRSVGVLCRLIGWPIAVRLWRAAASQPVAWLYFEGSVLIVVFATIRFRRWLRRSPLVKRLTLRIRNLRANLERRNRRCREIYAKGLANVAHKSRLLAAALPHATFCALVGLTIRLAPAAAAAIYGSPGLAASILLSRTRSTLRARREIKMATNKQLALTTTTSKKAQDEDAAVVVFAKRGDGQATDLSVEEIKFWICVCVERCLRFFLYALPYGARFSRSLDGPLAQFRGILLLWLTAFPALGYSLTARAARTALPSLVYLRRGTTTTANTATERWRRASVRGLSKVGGYARFVFGDKAARCAELFANVVSDTDAWLLLLVGGTGFCTIGPVARLAAVAVVFALPALAALKAVESREGTKDPPFPSTHHLDYFFVLEVADLALLNPGIVQIALWLPFKAHLAIALALWLQLPHLRGATRLFDTSTAKISSIIDKFKDA